MEPDQWDSTAWDQYHAGPQTTVQDTNYFNRNDAAWNDYQQFITAMVKAGHINPSFYGRRESDMVENRAAMLGNEATKTDRYMTNRDAKVNRDNTRTVDSRADILTDDQKASILRYLGKQMDYAHAHAQGLTVEGLEGPGINAVTLPTPRPFYSKDLLPPWEPVPGVNQ